MWTAWSSHRARTPRIRAPASASSRAQLPWPTTPKKNSVPAASRNFAIATEGVSAGMAPPPCVVVPRPVSAPARGPGNRADGSFSPAAHAVPGRRVVRARAHARLTFDGAAERWTILASGLVRGKIRAVVASLGPRQASGAGDKIVVAPGEMKLCYVIEGAIDVVYAGQTHHLRAGDSAYLDGGVDHRWANPAAKRAKVLWVITERRL